MPTGHFIRAYKNFYLSAEIDPIDLMFRKKTLRKELGLAYIRAHFGIHINYSEGQGIKELFWVPIF